MAGFSNVEDLFLQQALSEHGEYITKLLADSINQLGLIETDTLLKNLSFSVAKQGSNYVLHYSFMSYGRAIEIQYSKIKQLRREARKAGQKPARRQPKKDTRFYSRNAYGSINRLAGRMMYGLGAIEIEKLKLQLQNANKGG